MGTSVLTFMTKNYDLILPRQYLAVHVLYPNEKTLLDACKQQMYVCKPRYPDKVRNCYSAVVQDIALLAVIL